MGKYSTAQLDKVLLLMLQGIGAAEARKQVGVSHTPAELHVFRFEWLLAGLPQPGVGPWSFSHDLVNYLRFEATDPRGKKGWGIGRIMVALDATEGQVRKAIRESGVSDRGHRTGKGGRFFQDDSRFYQDTLKTEGTLIDLKSDKSPEEQAELQKLMRMEVTTLRELAKEAGIEPKGKTKAQLVRALLS